MGNETRGPQEYQAIIKIGLVSLFSCVSFFAFLFRLPQIGSRPWCLVLWPTVWVKQIFWRCHPRQSILWGIRFWNGCHKCQRFHHTEQHIFRQYFLRTYSTRINFTLKLMRWLQIGNYGPNCTTGNKTPHPSDPLLEELSTLQNTTISVPASSPFQFVNGTAIGLTCFVPPESTSYSWPYGDGQVNSEQADKGNGTSGTSTSTGSASQTSAASTVSSNGNESAARRVAGLPSMKGFVLAIAITWTMSRSITTGDFTAVF